MTLRTLDQRLSRIESIRPTNQGRPDLSHLSARQRGELYAILVLQGHAEPPAEDQCRYRRCGCDDCTSSGRWFHDMHDPIGWVPSKADDWAGYLLDQFIAHPEKIEPAAERLSALMAMPQGSAL
jgi:hypothetical protein